MLSLYDRGRVFSPSFIGNAFSCLLDILFYFWLHGGLKKKGNKNETNKNEKNRFVTN